MIAQRVLVVEDEPRTQDLILRALRDAGFRGVVAVTRAEVHATLAEEACVAMVLDLGLPGDDGLSILRELRKSSAIPVLILTGRAGIRERVIGLEAGADDYLSKPFAPEELTARLRAVLRRLPAASAAEARRLDTPILIGRARIDPRTRVAASPDTEARLTERELRILVELARASGPMPRPALYRNVLGREWDGIDRSLDVHVSHLRRKLRAVAGDDVVITSIRAEGYELRPAARFESLDES